MLITREDDKPEVVLHRLETYHRRTEPLKEYYGKRGILETVIGQDDVAETTGLVFSIIDNFGARSECEQSPHTARANQ